MNRKLIITIKVILFTVILGMALLTVAKIVENKSGYEKNSQFFTEANRNHLDMLFFGTSHVINESIRYSYTRRPALLLITSEDLEVL